MAGERRAHAERDSLMLELALTSFTTFFATVGPVEAAVVFAALTPKMHREERRRIAWRATTLASVILLVFTLFGQPLLHQLGVSIAALQSAGGVVLLLIALDMIFARPDSAFKLTPSEGQEAQTKEDLAVFPLATPLLAGPGAMSGAILLAANAGADPARIMTVVAALASVMGLTLALLTLANELSHVVGVTAQRVLTRVFGILLAGIAMQALFNGIGGSGLLSRL